jgi:ketosteroid isomerase-like protein
MGAAENVATIRGGYEAFNSGDLNALAEIFDESVVWHTPGRSSLASDYQGREATFGYFGRLGAETGGTFQAEPRHLVADDDLVVGIQQNRAERNGKHLDVALCLVFQLKEGRIVEAWEHFHDLYAWDAFWS